MDTMITIRNATKRAYTLPARVGPEDEKFGGVMLKPGATLVIPRWYLEALMEERSIAILFVEKKLEALDQEGEAIRFQARNLVPKKVEAPRYPAPAPTLQFPSRSRRADDRLLERSPAKGDPKLAKDVEELRAQVAELTKLLEKATAPAAVDEKHPPKKG